MRRKKRHPYRLILAFMVSLLVSFCSQGRESGAFSLTTEEERELGEKFLVQVQKNFAFLEDDLAQEYIRDLGQHLAKSVETRHFPFRFYIVKDHDLNAFAGPGGHIFIFSGLVNAVDRVDELAAVLSHEIAHVSARHLASRIEKSKKIGLATMAGLLAGILIGGEAGAAVATGSTAAGIQAQLHYSREDERQADQLGFKYTGQGGFDPGGLIGALKKIQRGQWLGTDKVPSYLLTHPTGPERMANLDVMLSGYSGGPEKGKTAALRSRFPLFKTLVLAKSMDRSDAERVFRRELEKNPDSPLAHFGLGVVGKERSNYEEAVAHLRKALEREPASVPILQSLGEAYQMRGQDEEAIRVLERALELDSEDRSVLFLLAQSYQNLEQYRKSIRLYERLVAHKPVKNQVHYNLGVSYGREGRHALAHYHFGIYFKGQGKKDMAKFHFEKAAGLSGNDPALRERIRKAMKGLS